MNVTLKLPDALCREARHRAVDEQKSLSGWLTALVERELAVPTGTARTPKTWMDAMAAREAPDWFYEREFPLEDRKATPIREFSFENETA